MDMEKSLDWTKNVEILGGKIWYKCTHHKTCKDFQIVDVISFKRGCCLHAKYFSLWEPIIHGIPVEALPGIVVGIKP